MISNLSFLFSGSTRLNQTGKTSSSGTGNIAAASSLGSSCLGGAGSLGSATASYLGTYSSFGSSSSGSQSCQNPYYGSTYNSTFGTGNSQNYSAQQVSFLKFNY